MGNTISSLIGGRPIPFLTSLNNLLLSAIDILLGTPLLKSVNLPEDAAVLILVADIPSAKSESGSLRPDDKTVILSKL